MNHVKIRSKLGGNEAPTPKDRARIRTSVPRFIVLLLCALPLLVHFSSVRAVSGDSEKPTGERPPEIQDAFIREEAGNPKVFFVIALSRKVEPDIFSLKDPPRLVIDVPSGNEHSLPDVIKPKYPGFLKIVRVGRHPDRGLTRFVLDFAKKGEYEIQPIVFTPDPNRPASRIVVEITRLSTAQEHL